MLNNIDMQTELKQTENFQLNYFNPAHIETVQRVAKIFTASELVPKIYKSSEVGNEKATANTIIALDMATRLNANPLMIMQNLNVIYGRPAWSSKFLISTVNTCGRFEHLKFRFGSNGKKSGIKYKSYRWNNATRRNEPVENVFNSEIEDLTCIAYTTVKGEEIELTGATVSVQMAILEGWYTKEGSKWPTMTQQMLMYRAASMWVSTYAPELSMGIKTEDETRDIIDITPDEIEPLNNIKEKQPEQTPHGERPKDLKSMIETV